MPQFSKFLLFAGVAILFSVAAIAQTIQGVVVDSKDNAPVAFAQLVLQIRQNGVLANESGEFELHLSNADLNDTLTFSRLGYHSYSLPVAQLQQETAGQLLIKMDKKDFTLSEVTVTGQEEWLPAYLGQVFEKQGKAMRNKRFLQEAFYRELSLKDSAYTRLIEAAVEVQDNGYYKPTDNRKVRVVEMRKSEDYVEYGLGSKLVSMLFDKENMLYETIDSDFLRKYKYDKRLSYADKGDFLDYYEFFLKEYMYLDSDTVLVVGFHSPLADRGRPYYAGELYINKTDDAILRFDYGMFANPIEEFEKQRTVFYQGKYFFKTSVRYRKFHGYYFPYYIEKHKPINFDAAADGQGQQFSVHQLMVGNVAVDRRDYDRIKRKNAQKRDQDLYEQQFSYNSAFWENYGMIKLNPLYRSAQKDLEKQEPLDRQFEKNGSK